MRIATLGPKGTYAEQAAMAYAKRLNIPKSDVSLIFTTVNNSLRLVQNLKVDYAVIPAENMIDGLIGSTFDSLIEYQDFVKVCDEIHLPISHVLATHPQSNWEEISRIYSHPSALSQCQNHLEELFPKADLVPLMSTAEAAANVLNDPEFKSAAICSPGTAKNKGLIIYNAEIQDYSFNETRFLVCALKDGIPTGNDRTLLAVRYGSNQPGQLYQTTKYLAEAKIDLACVQSRPYKVKPQEYVLIFELIGHKSDVEIENAIKEVEFQARSLNGWKKILGSFPKRDVEPVNDEF